MRRRLSQSDTLKHLTVDNPLYKLRWVVITKVTALYYKPLITRRAR